MKLPKLVVLLLLAVGFWILYQDNPTESLQPTKHNLPTTSFIHAKTTAERKIYTGDLKFDFYCGCKYTHTRNINFKSCGFQVKSDTIRGNRIEYEHVIPASWYGRNLRCWKLGGRTKCSQENADFQKFEGDLHNLRPVIGEINANRSNMPYGVSKVKKNQYGSCPFSIDYQLDVADPPDNIKGDIARISLFMNDKYDLKLPGEQVELFETWIQNDPVDRYEIEINRRIKAIQGDSNYYIERTNE